MFTGIITAVGQIKSAQEKGDGLHLVVEVPVGYLDDVVLGDSIAIQGACMTATQFEGNTFTLDISRESLSKTVGLDQTGPVNLEKALRLNDRLGGHLVSGHVDGVGKVVNGVSLTVNKTEDTSTACIVDINIIPHTLENTTLGKLQQGDLVNLEIDLIARYVARMLETQSQ